MDELVKELREDKKHAWEMINFLRERLLMTEKQGNNDDLHKKMDKILDKLDKQNELERKVEYLEDSVSKTDGKLQLLWENMDTIYRRIEATQGTMQFQDTVNEQQQHVEIEEQVSSSHNSECDKTETDVKTISKTITETTEEIATVQTEPHQPKVEENSAKCPPETESDDSGCDWGLVDTPQDCIIENTKKVRYKCYNTNCDYVFPENPSFEIDGVSVKCQNKDCEISNIIGNLNEGQKWMGNVRSCKWHYQQYPHDVKHLYTKECAVCKKMGIVYDVKYTAIVYDENMKPNKIVKKMESAVHKNRKPSDTFYRCFNANCKRHLTKYVEENGDGVHVQCPEEACRQKNIIGNLKDGNKWVTMKCGSMWHFQQIPKDKAPEEHTVCLVCENRGKSYAANDRTAVKFFRII